MYKHYHYVFTDDNVSHLDDHLHDDALDIFQNVQKWVYLILYFIYWKDRSIPCQSDIGNLYNIMQRQICSVYIREVVKCFNDLFPLAPKHCALDFSIILDKNPAYEEISEPFRSFIISKIRLWKKVWTFSSFFWCTWDVSTLYKCKFHELFSSFYRVVLFTIFIAKDELLLLYITEDCHQ